MRVILSSSGEEERMRWGPTLGGETEAYGEEAQQTDEQNSVEFQGLSIAVS